MANVVANIRIAVDVHRRMSILVPDQMSWLVSMHSLASQYYLLLRTYMFCL